MPHVSKKKLPSGNLRKLQRELMRSFERVLANMKARYVFEEFFTRTEKVMFAKRLAVIAMLHKRVSTYMISEVLAMSPSTTEKMSLRYEQGRYSNIIKNSLGKKDIWKILEDILSGGGIMPPKYGKGRWRKLDRHIYKKNLRES